MSTKARHNKNIGHLTRRIAQARAMTDALFALLSPESLFERPIPERHRIVFYVGHLEAFDWNLLGRTTLGHDPCDATLDDLFAFGIDPLDKGLPHDEASDWPSRAKVEAYVRTVRSRTDRLLADVAVGHATSTIDPRLLEVAVEHRLMHAETLAYLIQWLPVDQKRAPERRPGSLEGRKSRLPAMVTIPAGTATLGRPRNGEGFGWDNEFESTEIHVPEFRIDTCNVTNGDFLEFLRAGGYADRSLWSEVDWLWKSRAGIEHPKFWMRSEGSWMLRTMFDIRPLPEDWPVYISHAEARAYARWLGKELPTEAQFHRAAFSTPKGEERLFPWGKDTPGPLHGNFDFHRWDPVPVGSYPHGDSAWGVTDLLGNGWEWTASLFRPFRGFERFSFYPGYSADFFDARHFVMKGGSARTAACMLRRSFRNWFQPHYPHIYATLRCVEP